MKQKSFTMSLMDIISKHTQKKGETFWRLVVIHRGKLKKVIWFEQMSHPAREG